MPKCLICKKQTSVLQLLAARNRGVCPKCVQAERQKWLDVSDGATVLDCTVDTPKDIVQALRLASPLSAGMHIPDTIKAKCRISTSQLCLFAFTADTGLGSPVPLVHTLYEANLNQIEGISYEVMTFKKRLKQEALGAWNQTRWLGAVAAVLIPLFLLGQGLNPIAAIAVGIMTFVAITSLFLLLNLLFTTVTQLCKMNQASYKWSIVTNGVKQIALSSRHLEPYLSNFVKYGINVEEERQLKAAKREPTVKERIEAARRLRGLDQ